MGAHVCREVAGVLQCLAAGGAGVGAGARMVAYVSCKMAGPREGLATEGALKDEHPPPPLHRPPLLDPAALAVAPSLEFFSLTRFPPAIATIAIQPA